MVKPAKATKKRSRSNTDSVLRPYNRYNIFFILERESLLKTKGAHPTRQNAATIVAGLRDNGYENIDIPPLPPRYHNQVMADNWYIPKVKNEKRVHRKTHGVASFKDLASIIAQNWKTVDSQTYDYVATVERILKKRQQELLAAAALNTSTSPESEYCQSPQSNLNIANKPAEITSADCEFDHPRLPTIASSTGSIPYADPRRMQSKCNSMAPCPDNESSSALSFADVDDDDIRNMWRHAPECQPEQGIEF